MKLSNKIEFKIPCKVITPMFTNGAIANVAELRTGQLIGGMREWFRIFNADLTNEVINSEDNNKVSKLFSEESKLFGGTEGGAVFKLEITNNDIEPLENFKNTYQIESKFDNNQKQLIGKDSGIAYLFYTKLLKPTVKSKFISPGSAFEISISAIGKDTNEIFSNAIRPLFCLYALSIFGGIGSRQTRGAGNFSIDVKEIEVITGFNSFAGPAKKKRFEHWLQDFGNENIKSIVCTEEDQLETYLSRIIPLLLQFISVNKYDDNISFFKNIFSLNTQDSVDFERPKWFQLLNYAGKKYADYRSRLNIHQLTSFGLPLLNLSIIKGEAFEKTSLAVEENKDRPIAQRRKIKIDADRVRRKSQIIFTLFELNGITNLIVYKLPGEFLQEENKVIYYNFKNTSKEHTLFEVTPPSETIEEYCKNALIPIHLTFKTD